jgi:hypothetical protein
MTKPLAERPIPEGYYRFARHDESDWEMWVPPGTAVADDRLRAFQFRNSTRKIAMMSGPPPCVSAGWASVIAAEHEVYTGDLTNDYDGSTATRSPRIPRFTALWCSYVVSIAPSLNVRQIQIGNVANADLRETLLACGFRQNLPDYIGMIAEIAPKVQIAATGAGWTFG